MALDGTVLQVNLQIKQVSLFFAFFGGIFTIKSESGFLFTKSADKILAPLSIYRSKAYILGVIYRYILGDIYIYML